MEVFSIQPITPGDVLCELCGPLCGAVAIPSWSRPPPKMTARNTFRELHIYADTLRGAKDLFFGGLIYYADGTRSAFIAPQPKQEKDLDADGCGPSSDDDGGNEKRETHGCYSQATKVTFASPLSSSSHGECCLDHPLVRVERLCGCRSGVTAWQ